MNQAPAQLLQIVVVALTFVVTAPAWARGDAARGPGAASVGPTVDMCTWDRPGHDPFMGDVSAAVDRYRDIPADVRARLKARMAQRDYDDVVSIRRDSITGRDRVRYGSAIRDMHFGNATVCRTVTRAAWNAQMQERGLVYCESGECILVPTVCRNVSRIARAEGGNERSDSPGPEAAVLPVAALEPDGPAPLLPGDLPAALALDGGPSFAVPGGMADRSGSSFPGAVLDRGLAAFASATGAGFASSSRAAASRLESDVYRLSPSSVDGSVATTIAAVPEPESWAVLLGGLAVVAAWRRRGSRSTVR